RHGKRAWQKAKQSIHRWARKAMDGNMKEAHGYLKRPESLSLPELCIDPDSSGVIANLQSAVETRARQWKARWTKHDGYNETKAQMQKLRSRAALFSMAMDESSAWDGTQAWGSIYLDIKKFYDSISIPILIDRALTLDFPPVELYLNCLVYLAP
ncbi:unnamed protein product, partial [Prorocentrum cordatum]